MNNSTNFDYAGQDLCDYPMSDTAICEARRVGLSPGLPYRRGYRSRPRPSDRRRRADLKEILALNDADFRRYIQRGSRLEQDEPTDLRHIIEQLQETVQILDARVLALAGTMSSHATPTPQTEATTPARPARGLDVIAR